MDEKNTILEQYYKEMGISEPGYQFCSKIEESLKERF